MGVAAIAFTPVPAKQSPNIRGGTDSQAADAYYSAMVVAFASLSRLTNPPLLRLVSDAPIPERWRANFESLGVQRLHADFHHRPPQGFSNTFNASLYTLDAMRVLADSYPSDQIALIDPDCVVVDDLHALFGVAERGIGVFPTGFPATESSNGLSAIEAAELHTLLDPSLVDLPVHYGGECYIFSSTQIGPVLDRAERAYLFALERSSNGLSHFTTEEHLLNFGLRGASLVHIDNFIDRIWTAPVLRTVKGDEFGLRIWHLPAEKDRGFVRLRSVVEDRTSWFWTHSQAEFKVLVGRSFGLPRRSPERWLYDMAGRSARQGQRLLSRWRSSDDTLAPTASRL